MANPTEAFTKNSFVNRVMKWIPEDPLTQSKFVYYLTVVVFLGLLGYGVNAWYNFFTHSFSLSFMFSGMFMTAIALISVFGLKQTRNNYLMLKDMYNQQKQQEKDHPILTTPKSMEEILQEFTKKDDNGTKDNPSK